jgi:isocitrate lyase
MKFSMSFFAPLMTAWMFLLSNLHAETSKPLNIEENSYRQEVNEVSSWFASDRFKGIVRPYTPERVVSLRETLHQPYPSHFMSQKAWALFKELQKKGGYSHTFGALDPVQVIEMAPYLSSVYVSGWQCSSTASTSHEPGPDFADYPMDTVPTKVLQLFEAQRFHDRRQNEARSRMSAEEKAKAPYVDYLRPIIADADTGHGGMSAVMKLTKMFIQKGAAGIHFEDQKPGTKKCGHMSGKVLVSTQEHCDRLIGARLQADIMGSGLIIVARTDAEAANLLDTNIDPKDHVFILGTTNAQLAPLADVVRLATAKHEGKEQVENNRLKLEKLRLDSPILAEKVQKVWDCQNKIQAALKQKLPTKALEKQEGLALNEVCEAWNELALLTTYYDAVAKKLSSKPVLLKKWQEANDPLYGLSKKGEPLNALSHSEAQAQAKDLGVEIQWDWDAPRTFEGYYQVKGGVDMSIARARAFANYADMIWMETAVPSLEEAHAFSQGVRKLYPEKFLAYNLSPSFNWDKFGMSDNEIAAYQDELGKMGYVWQFITLAGFHGDALFAKCFAEDFANRKMLAYVETVQRKERENKVGALTHQKWSGVDLIGSQQDAATSGRTSTSASGTKSTEHQFAKAAGEKK